MEVHEAPEVYSRIIWFDEDKGNQVRLTVNNFRGIEYLHLRKYYLDFNEEWLPSSEGLAMPITMDNSRELFIGLVEILSLAESKEAIQDHFAELLRDTYVD